MRRYLAPAIDEVIVRTQALLVSGDLLRLINPGKDTIVDGFVFEDLGPVQLRGRDAPVDVFAVERRPPAQPELSTHHATQEHA
jgi:class 3 adenylate cyclase